MQSAAELLDQITPDAWRAEIGFNDHVAEANAVILDPTASEADIWRGLNGWLQRHQPCLFGRVAAKLDLISHCILREDDLRRGDAFVQDKIQTARTTWTREAFEGKKSAFVILVVSRALAMGLPDQNMKAFAMRLGSLYLLQPMETDRIYLDEIYLEVPGHSRSTWKWHVGANYFTAQADGRWWQDHRVPGGMALSMNSVGHMVKAGRLLGAMEDLHAAMGIAPEGLPPRKVDSLPRALEFAMRTIALASDAVSGKATALLQLERSQMSEMPPCPVKLPGSLEEKDYCTYRGYYHTDYTLPSEYFRPDVERPAESQDHMLDFTYLFVDDPRNSDFVTTGSGRRIRAGQEPNRPRVSSGKREKAAGQQVSIDRCPNLIRAIKP